LGDQDRIKYVLKTTTSHKTAT